MKKLLTLAFISVFCFANNLNTNIRIGINGFGRIGRTLLRTIHSDAIAQKKITIAAINIGSSPLSSIKHLCRYDSALGLFKKKIAQKDNILYIDENRIPLLQESSPQNIAWDEYGIDWVIEATGKFRNYKKAQMHRRIPNIKVLITAPSPDADIMIIPGVNHKKYDPQKHHIISLGSCTTNCVAPLLKVIDDTFGITTSSITSIHAYTNDQRVLDGSHSDPRRARAAALNIIPTKTGAASAIKTLLPHLIGKVTAQAIRVPVPVGSLIDVTFNTKKDISVEKIHTALAQKIKKQSLSILSLSNEPLVSSDIHTNPFSCVIDTLLTQALGSTGKIFAWYNNEWAYSQRIKDFLLLNS